MQLELIINQLNQRTMLLCTNQIRAVLGLVAILAAFSGGVSAQTGGHQRRELLVKPGQVLNLGYNQPYSSALIYVKPGQSLVATYLIVAGDTLYLQPDSHGPDGQLTSALCVFRHPVTSLVLQAGLLAGEVTLLTLYAPPLPAGYVERQMKAGARQQTDCAKPDVVPASIWRMGLNPPKEKPMQTKVQFVIVHHSAGSNATTNFAEEARNIYLLHTQINGWNDTGYNFLIGRDGVVYEGRDGQGLMDGDNVMGAHFCGQNSATMGICLMGNLSTVQPSDVSLTSLSQLIGWKLKKESLQPIGMGFHTGSARQLDFISGHRNGCATECPGNNLYAALPTIRLAVSKTCSFTAVVAVPLATENAETDWIVYPNPSRGVFSVEHKAVDPNQVSFSLVDAAGRTWPVSAVQSETDKWRIDVAPRLTGPFWLRCSDGNTTIVRPVLQMSD